MSNNFETPVERSFAVLPIKNTVLFPGLFLPLSVGRAGSRAAVDAAMATEDKTLVVVAQRDADQESPGLADVYPVGTVAIIKKMARGQEGIEVLVQGGGRVRLLQATQTEPYLRATVLFLPPPVGQGEQVEALHRAVLDCRQKGDRTGPPAGGRRRQPGAGAGPEPRSTRVPARVHARPRRAQGAGASGGRVDRHSPRSSSSII